MPYFLARCWLAKGRQGRFTFAVPRLVRGHKGGTKWQKKDCGKQSFHSQSKERNDVQGVREFSELMVVTVMCHHKDDNTDFIMYSSVNTGYMFIKNAPSWCIPLRRDFILYVQYCRRLYEDNKINI